MDSLSQFALGAAVAVAIAGRKAGPRKAVLVGGVLGTIPDLDVFIPLGDPVNDFIFHRGPSHSLFIQALAAPLIAVILQRLVKGLERFWPTVFLVYACFSTHAVLDAMTVYGTRIFWPFPKDPYAVGSLFIIDPLYTVPLLVLIIWALCTPRWTARTRYATIVCLGLSTIYAGWSMVGQRMASNLARDHLATLGIEPDRLMSSPTPFNTLYWKAIAIDGDSYINNYVSLTDGTVKSYVHERGEIRDECLAGIGRAGDLMKFAQGFFKSTIEDDRLMVSDLRMGVTPSYVFQFVVAEREGDIWTPIEPIQIRASRGTTDNDWAWLQGGIFGQSIVRDAEASGLIEGAVVAGTALDEKDQRRC